MRFATLKSVRLVSSSRSQRCKDQKNEMNRFTPEFEPSLLFRNRHVQTIFGSQFRFFSYLPKSLEWKVPSEGSVVLRGKAWFSEGNNSVVLLYHGLGGHSDSRYLIGAGLSLRKAGFDVIRMEYRGAESGPPHTPHSYHAGLTQDIEVAVKAVQDKGYKKIYIGGFSLSSNTILKWLAEGKKTIEKAFLVSPPVRLSKCCRMIDKEENRIYRWYFLRKLRKLIQGKAKQFPDIFEPLDRPQNFQGMWIFDDQITAPIHGFDGAEDYYEHASSFRTLRDIQNEITIVHALDDPFVDSRDLCDLMNHCPKNIQMHLFRNGGHMGFYLGLRKGHMLDRWIVQYFRF